MCFAITTVRVVLGAALAAAAVAGAAPPWFAAEADRTPVHAAAAEARAQADRAEARARTDRTEARRRSLAPPDRAALIASPFGTVATGSGPPDASVVPTRAGLYARTAEAQDIDPLADGQVLWLRLDCCAPDAVQRALGVAHALMAAHDLPADAPIFVDGQHAGPDAAAQLADRLADAGYTRAFLLVD
jgi:hypothetical protein